LPDHTSRHQPLKAARGNISGGAIGYRDEQNHEAHQSWPTNDVGQFGFAMKTIDEETELTPGQLELFAEDRERWAHISGGGHLEDWLAFGPGMVLRRTLAMGRAGTNKPEGRGYNEAMAELLERDGLHTMPRARLAICFGCLIAPST
jgi:hypothetical protein